MVKMFPLSTCCIRYVAEDSERACPQRNVLFLTNYWVATIGLSFTMSVPFFS